MAFILVLLTFVLCIAVDDHLERRRSRQRQAGGELEEGRAGRPSATPTPTRKARLTLSASLMGLI